MPPSETIQRYLSDLPFAPDSFQIDALTSVDAGRSVVVTAPTGAGKTVIAEGAIAAALSRSKRAFYTTPIKALSNQKFSDLREIHGSEAVGLLTGDNVINADANVIVMTTEVLRNMIYEGSGVLDDVGVVILDEVHYLADRHRGSVWEEVIIHLPQSIPIVCLSATIANPEEFTDWIRGRRGETDLVVEHVRPVPLTTMYAWRDRYEGGSASMVPMFTTGGRPNQMISKLTRPSKSKHRRLSTPRRTEVIEHLSEHSLLPVIYFVFSRKGCDQTAAEVANSSLALTTSEERREIRATVARRTAHLEEQDLAVLGFAGWLSTLERGAAAHHAGLVPAFKETVEELFLRGLVKVVAATETLALGINMPARTVVIDSLSKYTGEGHELLGPSDFTQLTGRAGRRGIDTEGTAVVLYSPYVPFERATGIAGAGSNALRSSFAPTYNMVVNLMAQYDEEEATSLLSASFANFAMTGRKDKLEESLAAREADLATFTAAAVCDRGDLWQYYDGSSRPGKPALDRQALQPGAIVSFAGGRFVLANRSWGGGQPKLEFIDPAANRTSMRSVDLPQSATLLGSIVMPRPVRISDRAYRGEIASLLELHTPDREPQPLFLAGNEDGVGSCPDIEKHIAWADRALRARRDTERLARRIARSEQTDIVDGFHSLRAVLSDTGYTKGWHLTKSGRSLRRLYNELDLLLAESIRVGLLDGLGHAEFASAVSLFTFESRGGEIPSLPKAVFINRILEELRSLQATIMDVERRHEVDEQRLPDHGFVDVVHGWASGHDLADLFDDDDVRAGDFVRSSRQLLDLLRQIRDGFPVHRLAASEAIHAVDRGIVEVGGLR